LKREKGATGQDFLLWQQTPLEAAINFFHNILNCLIAGGGAVNYDFINNQEIQISQL